MCQPPNISVPREEAVPRESLEVSEPANLAHFSSSGNLTGLASTQGQPLLRLQRPKATRTIRPSGGVMNQAAPSTCYAAAPILPVPNRIERAVPMGSMQRLSHNPQGPSLTPSFARQWAKGHQPPVLPAGGAPHYVYAQPQFIMGSGTTLQGAPFVHGSEIDLLMDSEGMFNDDMEEETDEKKVKRMMSNRASAKRSRQRRQERLQELEISTAKLRVENASASRRLTEALNGVKRLREENERLVREVRKLQEVAVGEERELFPENSQEEPMPAKEGEDKEDGSSGAETGSASPAGSRVTGSSGSSRRQESEGCFDSSSVTTDVAKAEEGRLLDTPMLCAAQDDALAPCPSSFSLEVNGTEVEEGGEDLINNEFFASLIDYFDVRPIQGLPGSGVQAAELELML